ncbi:hypothetical protein PWT90_09250 [Aphanocladium album]|nr:hypothetical protein PWT90_09250 [Aphanocladium album]
MNPLTQENFDKECRELGPVLVLDDLLSRHRGVEPSPVLFAYPRANRAGPDEDYFERYTAAQLDAYVDAVVRHLRASGHEPKLGRVVGMLGSADLDWLVHLFALSRLGYSVILMARRGKPVPLAGLLASAAAEVIFADASMTAVASAITALQMSPLAATVPFVPRDVYTTQSASTEIQPPLFPREAQTKTPALFVATSGSTGVPKRIPVHHDTLGVCLFLVARPGESCIVSWPLYHGWGATLLLGAMRYGATCFCLDTTVDATAAALVDALESARPEYVPTVPHNLELMARDERALPHLRAARDVAVGGAALPDDLGDELVRKGVHVSSLIGMSETARNIAMARYRAAGDDDGAYVEFLPMLRRHILLDPVAGSDPAQGLHELGILPTFPGLLGRRSDDGSGSGNGKGAGAEHRMGDILRPHPTRPDRWKFVCREGDFIALRTGAKTLGFPIESRVQASPLVEAAVVVGVGRTSVALLVVPAAAGMTREEFVEAVWPVVEAANAAAAEHGEVKRDKIYVLPRGTALPRTEKGNVVRKLVYEHFASEIDSLYS